MSGRPSVDLRRAGVYLGASGDLRRASVDLRKLSVCLRRAPAGFMEGLYQSQGEPLSV